MAAWYYTRDGEILGPYSEEAMTGLIDNGSVTFVTLVWDSDTKSEGKEWTYAYDTSLASYFSIDIPTDDLPNLSDIEMPPIPPIPGPVPEETPPIQAAPEPPQPEPTETEPPSPETADHEKEPRKTPLLIVIFIALFIIGLIIGAASWYLTH